MPTPPFASTMRSIHIRLDEAVGFFDGGLELFFEGLDFLRIGVERICCARLQSGRRRFDVVEGVLFLGPVLGADGWGAFEGHVLEHVREAGAAIGVVDRAGVHVGVEGDHRGFVAFDHQDEVQAVGEGELGDFFLELLEIGVGQILGGEIVGGQQAGQQEC